jgi:hypothetical protein
MKYLALRSGPFPFLRGTCHLFYERLASSGFGASAPPVWCCGDLHLENFVNYPNSRTGLVRKRRRLLVEGRRALPVPQADYVLLVEGHGSPDRDYLFELAQAVPAVLGRHFHAGQGFVLRSLQPSGDRLPFERFGTERERIEAAASLLARCLAWAQVARAAAAMTARVKAYWAAYAAAYDAGQFQVAAGE